jgi:hypothetical protein
MKYLMISTYYQRLHNDRDMFREASYPEGGSHHAYEQSPITVLHVFCKCQGRKTMSGYMREISCPLKYHVGSTLLFVSRGVF